MDLAFNIWPAAASDLRSLYLSALSVLDALLARGLVLPGKYSILLYSNDGLRAKLEWETPHGKDLAEAKDILAEYARRGLIASSKKAEPEDSEQVLRLKFLATSFMEQLTLRDPFQVSDQDWAVKTRAIAERDIPNLPVSWAADLG